VADQRSDPASHLHLCRDLIALRRETPELRSGDYASLPSPDGVWAWRRGEDIDVAVNLSGEAASLPLGPATIEIGTDRSRDGEIVDGELRLGPWEGAVLRRGP
jgi:alpha-glucosidase